MAMKQRFEVGHAVAFPNGAFLRGEVEAVADFNGEKRADGSRPQQHDKETGLPLWQCVVIDGDEDAGRKEIGVTVKFAAKYQPVPPENKSGMPWTPVEFVGLTALPYVDDNGVRPRIAWSFRATDIVAPGQGRTAAKPPESKSAA